MMCGTSSLDFELRSHYKQRTREAVNERQSCQQTRCGRQPAAAAAHSEGQMHTSLKIRSAAHTSLLPHHCQWGLWSTHTLACMHRQTHTHIHAHTQTRMRASIRVRVLRARHANARVMRTHLGSRLLPSLRAPALHKLPTAASASDAPVRSPTVCVLREQDTHTCTQAASLWVGDAHPFCILLHHGLKQECLRI